MKATLEFQLPEEKEDFELAARAGEMSSKLFEIEQEIRKIYKYQEFNTIEAKTLIEDVYKLVLEIIKE